MPTRRQGTMSESERRRRGNSAASLLWSAPIGRPVRYSLQWDRWLRELGGPRSAIIRSSVVFWAARATGVERIRQRGRTRWGALGAFARGAFCEASTVLARAPLSTR